MSNMLVLAFAAVVIALVGCAAPGDNGLVADIPAEPMDACVTLTPHDLYSGLEAHRAILSGNSVVLDTRNWAVDDLPGRIVTDVIDLGSGAIVALPVRISNLRITTDATSPDDVATLLRHGPTFFQTDRWSSWEPASGGLPIDTRGDRYVQLRLLIKSDSPANAPGVKGVKISFTRQAAQTFQPKLAVKEHKVQQIVRSTVPFEYERMDQADLAWLRKSCELDKVVAGRKSEMGKLIALLEWASMRRNVRGEEGNRHMGGSDPYPWNIRKIFGLENGGTVYGHCASYSQLLITAAGSLGWHARHVNNEGYRTCTHEVAEIWVNELGKWVYFDPSLGTYYTDRRGAPLSMLQMHDRFVDFFVEDGKTLKDYLPRVEKPLENDKGWQRRRKLDMGKLDAICRTNDYTYGEHTPWDWTEGQGIMSAGFLQLTPRNNFNSKPQPPFLRYGYSPEGVNGFPCFTDGKTPLWYDQAVEKQAPDGWTRNWVTRRRDFNWTLNQASFRLTRTGPDEVTVELGNSQPFFRGYRIEVNGQAREATSPFVWKLSPGKNTLTATCVDEFGQKGIPSSVAIELDKR